MVKQHSFDCSTIRFTSQRNCSFFLLENINQMSAPNAGKVFFYNHSRVRFLSRCPKQLNRTFERIIFFTIAGQKPNTDRFFFSARNPAYSLQWYDYQEFFSHTHTHTHKDHDQGSTHTHTIQSFFLPTCYFCVTNRETKSFFFLLKSSRTNFNHPTWVRLPKSPPSHRPLPDQIQLRRRVCPHQKEPRREMLQGTHLRPLPGIRTWRSVQTRTRLESRTLITRTQTFSSDSWTISQERAHHRHQNQVPSWTQQPLSWWTGMWNS